MATWKSEALAVESLGAAVRLGLRSTVSWTGSWAEIGAGVVQSLMRTASG
jgi:hypothetical protein